MLDELAREFTSGLARVGRRTVRSFIYTPEDWLLDHGGAGLQDYLDWLVLIGIMQDRVRDEGLFHQEVPFSRVLYSSWLGANGLADNAENRSEYLRTMDADQVKECKQALQIRPAAPKGQSCTAVSLLLPVSIDWDQPPAVTKRISGALDEAARGAIAVAIAEAYDLDTGLDLISEYRCNGCQLTVYPKFVDAGDFDDLFGYRFQNWVRHGIIGDQSASGFTNRMPRAKAPNPKDDGYSGLCVGVYGCMEEITKLTTLEMNDEDSDRIAAIVCGSLGLPPDCVWCSDSLVERGDAAEECMALMGDYANDDGVGILGLPGSKATDTRLASLVLNPVDLGVEPPKPKGVVLPFAPKSKQQ